MIKRVDNVKKLIEARKLFNKLGDTLYIICSGEFENSEFAAIYNNFEKVVCDEICEISSCPEFVEKYFCSMILDMAQEGYTKFLVNEKTTLCSNAYDLVSTLTVTLPYKSICYIDFEGCVNE